MANRRKTAAQGASDLMSQAAQKRFNTDSWEQEQKHLLSPSGDPMTASQIQ
jgi:hypothetical protein